MTANQAATTNKAQEHEMTYTITGTGNQAPYGIGEIISEHRTLNAACKAARKWYNRPAVRDSDGNRYHPDTLEEMY